MVKTCIITYRMEQWFGGEVRPILDLVRLAESKGIDAVAVTDHVVMSELGKYDYPYPTPDSASIRIGSARRSPNLPQFDPVAMLGALASVTGRIKLSTSILIVPLRPAALLAKQLATLDAICGGRLELAVGVGWQQSEYVACGVPWEGRFGRLIEHVDICRKLWRGEAVQHRGSGVHLDDVYCHPMPKRPGGIPLYFGLSPTDRNIERIAKFTDGWEPLGLKLGEFEVAVRKIHAKLSQNGRYPADFSIRVHPVEETFEGRPNLQRTLLDIREFVAMGATCINVVPAQFVESADEFEPFLDELLSITAAR